MYAFCKIQNPGHVPALTSSTWPLSWPILDSPVASYDLSFDLQTRTCIDNTNSTYCQYTFPMMMLTLINTQRITHAHMYMYIHVQCIAIDSSLLSTLPLPT